jgi:hypothetical protein
MQQLDMVNMSLSQIMSISKLMFAAGTPGFPMPTDRLEAGFARRPFSSPFHPWQRERAKAWHANGKLRSRG